MLALALARKSLVPARMPAAAPEGGTVVEVVKADLMLEKMEEVTVACVGCVGECVCVCVCLSEAVQC